MASKLVRRNGVEIRGQEQLNKFWSELVEQSEWARVFDTHNGVFDISCTPHTAELLKNKIGGKMRAVGVSGHFDVLYDYSARKASVCLSPSSSVKAYAELAQLVFDYQRSYGYKVLPPAFARVPVSSHLP